MSNTLPLFQQYTPYDTKIVKTATRYGLYLIGGTAIDLLCRYYSIPFWRSRSNNDLDFWTTYDNNHKDRFIRHIKRTLGFVVKEDSDYMLSLESSTIHTDTDILIDYDRNNCKFGYTMTLSKILCKWKQDSVVSLFLYLNSVFKHKHKLIHNQAPV